ncbi:MAG: hypothetical protein HGA65_04550 [Oscillochloris sp.]|nr:hypothetical protein [Oscillochloris sp.]
MTSQPKKKRWQALGRQLARLALLLLGITLLLISTTVAAIGMQAQRDETRGTDLLFVIAPAAPPTPLVEHSLELYRRGYGRQIALAGPGWAQLRADLLGRGVPAEALASGLSDESLLTALSAVRRSGTASLLIVSAPADQLLGLKAAHDQGLQAYGSPVSPTSPDLPTSLLAAIDYWRYALLYR